jgi:hypothetical protein
MTQDEILDALYKVVQENKHYTTWTVSTPHLVALVNLAIEHEREACAKVCDEIATEDGWEGSYAYRCVEAIRARSYANDTSSKRVDITEEHKHD